MRGSRNFRQGGVWVCLSKKSSDNVFLVVHAISKKPIIFQGSREGPTISRGVQLFPGGGGGGSNSLFTIEKHITCDFPGGWSGPPVLPLWIRTWTVLVLEIYVSNVYLHSTNIVF